VPSPVVAAAGSYPFWVVVGSNQFWKVGRVGLEQQESPRPLDRPGLAALLVALRCLRRPGRIKRTAPFSPARGGFPDGTGPSGCGASARVGNLWFPGLKGARLSTKVGDVSTATTGGSEEHSEPPELIASGLSCCLEC
jgi:hypothetical protein